MKPITGTVVSSKPLPLSQAALVLSKFLEMNTGADREMLVYLRRSSEAFDELVDFHRDIKVGGVVGDGDGTKRKKIEKRDEQEEEERSDGSVVQRRDLVEGEGKKKKSTEEKKLAEEENDTNDGLVAVDEEKAERKKKRNKKKDGEDGEKEHLSKKEGENTEEYRGENGLGEIEVDKKEKKKKKKKRKHVEDKGVVEGDGGREDENEEHQPKKKKRKKFVSSVWHSMALSHVQSYTLYAILTREIQVYRDLVVFWLLEMEGLCKAYPDDYWLQHRSSKETSCISL